MKGQAVSSGKIQLILLVLLVLFSPLAIDIYLPALSLISETFHVEQSLAKSTISLFLFSMGIGQIFAGPLADKYGRRAVAIAGVGIYAVSALLAWSAQSMELMLLSRLTQGLGACATSVAAFATVRDLFGPQKSGRIISYLNGAICFIPALAPILGSWLTQTFGWRANFCFMTIFAVSVWSLLWLYMKETAPCLSKAPVFKFQRYWDVIRNPMFLFHAILCQMAMAVVLAYVTCAPFVLIGDMGISMDNFTNWFAINAIVNILACLFVPRLMDWCGVRFVLVSGVVTLLVAGVMLLALYDGTTPIRFMVPIFVSSVGFASILGAAAGKALEPFGDKAGTAAAMLGLLQMSGSGFLVWMMQSIIIEPQFLIATIMFMTGPALFILLSKTGQTWYLRSLQT